MAHYNGTGLLHIKGCIKSDQQVICQTLVEHFLLTCSPFFHKQQRPHTNIHHAVLSAAIIIIGAIIFVSLPALLQ